jgi:predicted ABC-type ATPase
MKKILIIAGPNGAGKTTFALEFLPNEAACPEFINADLIAAGISPFRPENVAVTAGRLMLQRINELADSGKSFAFETTLSSRSFLRMIPTWKAKGYNVELCFLKLPNVEYAIHRVAQRVSFGGHNIPVETIHRRFARGWDYFKNDYIGIVDKWVIYDASETPPLRVESSNHQSPPNLMEDPVPYQNQSSEDADKEQSYEEWINGMTAALKRASEKACAQAIAAGLEPIVRKRPEVGTGELTVK